MEGRIWSEKTGRATSARTTGVRQTQGREELGFWDSTHVVQVWPHSAPGWGEVAARDPFTQWTCHGVFRCTRPQARWEGWGLGEHVPEGPAGCSWVRPAQQQHHTQSPQQGDTSHPLQQGLRGGAGHIPASLCPPVLGVGPTKWLFLNVRASSKDRKLP